MTNPTLEIDELDEVALLKEIEDDQEELVDDEDKEFDILVQNLRKSRNNEINEFDGNDDENIILSSEAHIEVRPPVAEDFVRNFLVKMNMHETLNLFEHEWYAMDTAKLINGKGNSVVPDVYAQCQILLEQVTALREELEICKSISIKAKTSWKTLRKQRDLHKMHHLQALQEKDLLATKTKQLEKHMQSVEPLLNELKSRCESSMKDRTLLRLERDRLAAKLEHLNGQEKIVRTEKELSNKTRRKLKIEPVDVKRAPKTDTEKSQKRIERKIQSSDGLDTMQKKSTTQEFETKLLLHASCHPYSEETYESFRISKMTSVLSQAGHSNAIAAAKFHPTKPVIATGSDDEAWKLWKIPSGELILSGKGHQSWIADVAFHPHGLHLATSSGDNTIKVWDFMSAHCSTTLCEHSHPIWESAFSYSGDFLISASMDHTSKLWDLKTEKCRKTFRGHVDSVNCVCFQPFTVNFYTGSGDKTVSLWDIRTGLCVQTFYGHGNAVNSVASTLRGDTLASCDADGCIKVWDVRMIAERGSFDCGRNSLNSIAFHRSGEILASASNDSKVKVRSIQLLESPANETSTEELIKDLEGHNGPAQAVAFDPSGQYFLSSGSDCTFCIWSLN